MTEEGAKKHAVNGGTDGQRDQAPNAGCSQSGGRLKFFKDGKFILELAQAREGEKVAWVSVPKKTFWPPKGTSAAVTYRQESSTSLSVSDDNSSVQSSPWQRDHFWKQASPRKNASASLCFHFHKRLKPQRCRRASVRKRRRPFDDAPAAPCGSDCAIVVVSCAEEGEGRTDGDGEGPRDSPKRRTKCNSSSSRAAGEEARAGRRRRQRSLAEVLQAMLEAQRSEANSSVSPRKRILREFEKVTLDDVSTKRSRGKGADAKQKHNAASQAAHNGLAEDTTKICSYSINSLLGNKMERGGKTHEPHVPHVSQVYPHLPQDDKMIDKHHPIPASLHHVYPFIPPFMYPAASSTYLSPLFSPFGRSFVDPYRVARPDILLPQQQQQQQTQPPTQPPQQPEIPSCSWAPLNFDKETDGRSAQDDPLSDVPLNLSKHAS